MRHLRWWVGRGERRQQAWPDSGVCVHRHRHNGTCPNALHISVAEMNEAVLQAIEEHALTPEAIEQVIQLTERDDVRDQQAKLERERKEVAKGIERITEAIEMGGEIASLVAKLSELEARLKAIREEAASLRPVPRLAPAILENRLADGDGFCAPQQRRAGPSSSACFAVD